MRVIVYKCPVCGSERFRIIEVNGTTDLELDDLIFECLECANEWNIRDVLSRPATFHELIIVHTR